MRDAFVLLLLILCGVLAPVPASAQAPGAEPSNYVIRRLSTGDGLPHNWIRAALQTRDGYLWFGTNNAGLVRFDGLAFTTFNVLGTPALASDTITCLHEDVHGTLWIGTVAGLARYADGTFTRVPLDGLSGRAILDLRSDRDGKLWVASDGGVARRDGASWTVVRQQADTRRLWPSSDGTLWIATSAQLLEWRDRVVRTFDIPGINQDGGITALRQDRAGHLWIGTSSGLARLDPSDEQARVKRIGTRQTHVTALFEDTEGALWLGVPGGVERLHPDGTSLRTVLTPGDPHLGTATIVEDREGNVWVGMEGRHGGLFRLKPARVSMVTLDRLPCANIGAITEGPDGTIWLSAFCDGAGGVFALRGGALSLYSGPTSMVVSAILAERDGVWVGTYGGSLYRIIGSSVQEVQTIANGPHDAVMALYRHPDGTLWAGTLRSGVMRLRDGRWTRLNSHDGLPSDDVHSIAGGPSGDVWIGTAQGVSRYHDGRLTTYRVEDGAPVGAVRALHVDRDGAVWVGSYGGGLARVKDSVWFRFGLYDGVLDTSVHRILEDDEGYLWLTGDRGIRRVSKRDLTAIADGHRTPLDITLFDETDGMRSVECNGMAQPAGWRTRDGAIYVPTQAGLARIDPAQPTTDAPGPQPHIEQAIVDGTPSRTGDELVVAPGYRDLEFRFTAPAFARPELVQFRYRVQGLRDDWVDVGTRRVASFVNVPPGRYRFEISARSGGAWSTESATLIVVLQPHFYQRRSAQVAFGALALIVAAGGAWSYVRRTRRRARELERAVAERTGELSSAHERLATAHRELVRAKQDAEQAHEQVLTVLNQLGVGALVLGPGGVVRYVNASAQRVLGKNEHALVGQSWSVCLPLIDADRARIKARVEGPSTEKGRVPVQMVIGGARYWSEIDVCDEPPPADGRIIYLHEVTEVSPQRVDAPAGPFRLVGRSTAMQVLVRELKDVARVDSTVLVEGETGVGKELVARAIHQASSRADRPFIALNAAGLTESLLASQLFGHRRGAFTGAVDTQIGLLEAANGGTLFLDEIGDMPATVQASLLRVLQEREIMRLGESQSRRVDVRFLAATHRDLAREVQEGRFRQDLLYRIRVATLRVPALRDRIPDIPLLVDHFLKEALGNAPGTAPVVSREAMDALMRYDWPGNVRELRAAIECAIVGTRGGIIRVDDLPATLREAPHEIATGDDSERGRILDALRRARGNRAEAARLLGIGRTTLYRRLSEYGIDVNGENAK